MPTATVMAKRLMMLKVKPSSPNTMMAPSSEMGMASTTANTVLSLPRKISVTSETAIMVMTTSFQVSLTVASMETVVSETICSLYPAGSLTLSRVERRFLETCTELESGILRTLNETTG